MVSWNELVKSALLGTEKAPLQADILPEKIKQCLSENDREAAFLQAATLTWAYRKTGQMAQKLTLEEVNPAPAETRPFCSKAATNILDKILADQSHSTALLGLLLEKIKQQGEIVPHGSLTALLDAGSTPEHQHLRSNIAQVMGERGRWLLPFKEIWANITGLEDSSVWETGAQEQRVAFLENLRKENPAEALELLRTAWPNENARSRLNMIHVLKINRIPQDLEFTAAVFEEMQNLKGGTKPVVLEIKKACSEILLSDPATELYQWALENLKAYLLPDKKAAAAGAKYKLCLPEVQDDFLNTKIMVERLGFDKTNSGQGIFDYETWFLTLLENLHPSAWETLVDDDWPTIFAFFEQAQKATKARKVPFLDTLSLALANTRYEKGIKPYLQSRAVNHQNFRMLDIFTPEDIQNWLLKNPTRLSPQLVETLLCVPALSWSGRFTELVIKSLIANPENPHHSLQTGKDFSKKICPHLDVSAIQFLQEALTKEDNDWRKEQTRKHLTEPMLHLMELREEIRRI